MTEMPERQVPILLERIAVALERIASHLEPPDLPRNPRPRVARPVEIHDANLPLPLPTAIPDFPSDPDFLVEFLAKHKITIKSIPPRDEGDEVLDKLAQSIGSRHASVKKLLDAVKRNLDSGNSFYLNLKNESQKDLSSICQLASQLHEIAFLTKYHYENSPKFQFWAQPSRFPKAINFFTGGWLERYLRSQVLSALNWCRPGRKVSCLSGVKVALPNGDDFELDLLVAAGQDVFWFEAKSGDYQDYVQKYARMSNLLGLGQQRSVMVLTDLSRSAASAIGSLFKMTVTPIADLDGFLEQLFGAQAADEPV